MQSMFVLGHTDNSSISAIQKHGWQPACQIALYSLQHVEAGLLTRSIGRLQLSRVCRGTVKTRV